MHTATQSHIHKDTPPHRQAVTQPHSHTVTMYFFQKLLQGIDALCCSQPAKPTQGISTANTIAAKLYHVMPEMA